MNRNQFYVLTGLSSLVVLLLIGHIFLAYKVGFDQNRFAAAQRVISQGELFQENWKQLAMRIAQDSQKTQDPGLKDLLTRQQISFTPKAASGNAAASPAPPTPSSPQ